MRISGLKKEINKSVLDKKALLVLLYFCQYGLLLPLTSFLQSNIPIMVFTIIIVLYINYKYGIRLSSRTRFLMLAPLVILMLKIPFELDYPNVAFEMLIAFLTIGISGILIGSLDFSYESFLYYGNRIAWLNFLLLFYIPFLDIYRYEVGYMAFGYAILPSVVFSFTDIIRKKNIKSSFILFVLSFLELLIFGARGAMLTFIIYAFVLVFFTSITSFKLKSIVISIIVGFALTMFTLFQYLTDVVGKYGGYSYSLTQYLNVFNGKSISTTSSGRDFIFAKAYSRIWESPFFGSPLNTVFKDTGTTYYHNLFLDLFVNYGIIFSLLFLLYLLVKFFSVIRTNNNTLKVVFLILFMIPFGRLLVSSSFWQRPEFWVFMSYSINLKNIKRK